MNVSVWGSHVAAPPLALIGQEGEGWKQVTAELAFERSGPERVYSSVVLLDACVGGSKKTGNGHREAGLAALDVFSEWKSIYVDYSGKIQKAQIDVPAGASPSA